MQWTSSGMSLFGRGLDRAPIPSVTICLQPRAIAPRGGEAVPKECQPRDQGLCKTIAHAPGWGPSVCRRAPCVMSWGASQSHYSSPGSQLGALTVSAQTPVSELEALQFLMQPVA